MLWGEIYHRPAGGRFQVALRDWPGSLSLMVARPLHRPARLPGPSRSPGRTQFAGPPARPSVCPSVRPSVRPLAAGSSAHRPTGPPAGPPVHPSVMVSVRHPARTGNRTRTDRQSVRVRPFRTPTLPFEVGVHCSHHRIDTVRNPSYKSLA